MHKIFFSIIQQTFINFFYRKQNFGFQINGKHYDGKVIRQCMHVLLEDPNDAERIMSYEIHFPVYGSVYKHYTAFVPDYFILIPSENLRNIHETPLNSECVTLCCSVISFYIIIPCCPVENDTIFIYLKWGDNE